MIKENFSDKERRCELTFCNSGPWYHLFTPGVDTPILLKDEDDLRYCQNLLARCVKEYSRVTIIAYALMDNHIHIVLSGDLTDIGLLFTLFRRRLSRYLRTKYTSVIPKTFQMTTKPIEDLRSLRNTIVYVNRNGYVVSPQHTPFSYPWSSGICYFNIEPAVSNLASLTIDRQRSLLKGRVPQSLRDAKLTSYGCVAPSSFCSYELGAAMFRDAHQYYYLLSKSVESYSEIAVGINDGEFLTDQELFTEVGKMLKVQYGSPHIKNLSQAQKMDLARKLRFEYKSSNGQIRRLLGIREAEIRAMFPGV